MISLWISGRLSDPIRHMNQEAVKLARADYSASFEGGYFTETADLASTLNDATQKLNRIDDLRKDLINNSESVNISTTNPMAGETPDPNGVKVYTGSLFIERGQVYEDPTTGQLYLIENGLGLCGLEEDTDDEEWASYGCISEKLRADWTHLNS